MRTCTECGQENPDGFRVCGMCGSPVEAVRAREARKIVTIVFTDLVGSSELGERLDPKSLRQALAIYFERMKAVVEQHGGTVSKFIGDAVMAVFGIPMVREDDALRGVRAADELRAALRGLNQELSRRWGITRRIRTGVNTGEVLAGNPIASQELVVSDAVNVALAWNRPPLPVRCC